MSEVMTIRVDRKTKNRLEKLAKAMERTKSYVAAEAIRAYVELNEWQITKSEPRSRRPTPATSPAKRKSRP